MFLHEQRKHKIANSSVHPKKEVTNLLKSSYFSRLVTLVLKITVFIINFTGPAYWQRPTASVDREKGKP